jgi:group II intron reverse transcriptase/maturase
VEAPTAANGTERPGASGLMEQVCERRNLQAALKRVRKNKGSAGIDGMTVEELPAYLVTEWPRIRQGLLAGTYHPQPVKRATIPKSDGGERELGIPTVLDRFIQQALLQVLQPRFDPSFSKHSYGFRPGRSAHDAVRHAQRYAQEGRRWVVDIDLEKFFDRVNHDVLMGRLAKRIEDRRVLALVRRYLDAGILAGGVIIERHEGTPQGGPLSPLLANMLLDEVDKELEKRGHAFVRYADDLNVYVRSKRAGERVMATMRRLYERIRLRINESKSAVALVSERKFLSFTLWITTKGEVKRRIAPQALERMKDRVRAMTRRVVGRSVARVCEDLALYLRGWKQYFQIAEVRSIFKELDAWIRHRLRALQLKQWRHGRVIYRELRARDMDHRRAAWVAANARRWWAFSSMPIHFALPNALFDELGIPRLAA